jgi:hypothetical protein
MRRYGFSNDAAEAIWADHLGNNAFVRHRDQCSACTAAYQQQAQALYCNEGNRIFHEVLDDVFDRIDETKRNGN